MNISKFSKFAGTATLGIALAGCAVINAPTDMLNNALGVSDGSSFNAIAVSDNLIEKDADHTWEVADMASWNAVAEKINNAGESKKHIITVSSSFTANAPPKRNQYTPAGSALSFNARNIAVVIEGSAAISLSSIGYLLEISNGQAIIVKDIKLQGHSNNAYSLVNVAMGGKLIMEGSASVSGNTAKGSSTAFGGGKSVKEYPGGVMVYSGTFIMKDNASVSGNTSISETFGQGGGVGVSDGGTFIMQDYASVTNNIGVRGGGVYVSNGAFIMQGNAKISNNTAREGGGVCVFGLGHNGLAMKDNAVVSGNTANNGGGVYAYNGTFTMQDNAKVSGNITKTGDEVFPQQNDIENPP